MPVNHETRLALVLNGGVSLAVWMGGVTHELDLLRQASGDTREDSVQVRDQAVFNIWKRISRKTGTRVVIDAVAGSSAGGLNGMLLATALSRGAAIPDLRQVWEDAAALENLLERKAKKTSVLSGSSFEAIIKNAVDKIGLGAECARNPVTLFLPATSLDGRSRLYCDGFENEFSVRDHRRLYRFQHDETFVVYAHNGNEWGFKEVRKTDFVPGNVNALVQAARATASFPVAFPPVNESSILQYRVHPKSTFDDPASFVIDGGVLNNAPFSPVLEAISLRTLDVPVQRVLVYVVPSMGRKDFEDKERFSEATPWNKIAVNATLYPQEADLRESSQNLATKLGGSVRDPHIDLFKRASDNRELAVRLTSLAKELLGEYRRNRARGVIYDLRRVLADGRTVTHLAVTPEPSDEHIDVLIDAEGTRRPNWVPTSSQEELTNPLKGEWHWGSIPAERVLQSLSHDLHSRVMKNDLGAAQQERLLEGSLFITERLREAMALMEAYEAQIRLHDTADTCLPAQEAAWLIHENFSSLNVPKVLGGLVKQAAIRYVNALRAANIPTWGKPEEMVSLCLSVEVVTRAYAAPSKVVEPLMPEFQFLRLGPDKMSRILFEDRFADMGDRKLYGTRFQHFAAFFAKDWRKNDFTWGRLDAAHHLLRLFTFQSEEERRDVERELHREILKAEAPQGLDPCDWMAANLKELSESTDNQLLKKVTDSKHGRKVFNDAADSVLEVIGINRIPVIRTIPKLLRGRILQSYTSAPRRTLFQAAKTAMIGVGCTIAWVILVLIYALLFLWVI
ncbi:hypothetical protein GCM10009730_39160 [Streptomyces albidochromogenes]